MTRWFPVLVLVLLAALGTTGAEEGTLPADLRPVAADGQRVAEEALGLKQGQGSLQVGFRLTGAAGNNFRTEIDEVEIELYDR